MIIRKILKYFFIIWICFFPPIAIHEIGHFLVAKMTGIGTQEISIGFGPGISKTINDDKYSLRILPLGGFVKLEDENSEIYHKEHLLTLLIGPANNLLLAFLCFFIYYYFIFKNMLISKNNNTTSFKFKNISLFKSVQNTIFEFDSNEKSSSIRITESDPTDFKEENEILLKSVKFAIKKTNIFSHKDQYFKDLSRVFFLKDLIEEHKSLGPIGIVTEAMKHLNRSFLSLIYFVGEISLSVGILNFLPIYPLDGGKIWPIILKIKESSQVIQSAPELSYLQIIGILACSLFFTYIFLRDIGINIRRLYKYWRNK